MLIGSEIIADMLRNPDRDDPLLVVPKPDVNDLIRAGSASLDLRLGTWFGTLRGERTSCLAVSSRHTEPSLVKLLHVPFGKPFYLHPKAFVLASTLEWIRVPSKLAGSVTARSSWGRRGLIIATATGVHPGFTGCLTLELANVGAAPIELRPGMSLCQLFFEEVNRDLKTTDKSRFLGRRKPILGKIDLDWIAKALQVQNP
ncbi:MAG: dCTP deaminase [Candidatus Hydrogenedentes bacterium]|nr:dCTP deaminase [Candidatus Hydrogenedentota bacterium]